MPWKRVSLSSIRNEIIYAQGSGWILPIGCALKLHGGIHHGSPLAFISPYLQGISIVALDDPQMRQHFPAITAPSSNPLLPPFPSLSSFSQNDRVSVWFCSARLAPPFGALISPLEIHTCSTITADESSKSVPPESWHHLASQIEKRSVVVALGDKDTGKSTLSLFLCNYLASTTGCVYLLDTDPGQPDLSPSALVSLHRFEGPCCTLHGPAWSRVHRSSTSIASFFFGSTTPKQNPSLFIDLVTQLAEIAAKERVLRPGPLIVNTPGWLRGFGPILQQQIVRSVQATDLVMLHQASSPAPLSPEEVANVCPEARTLHLGPLVRSAAPRLAAGDARELCLTSYLRGEHTAVVSFGQVQVSLPHGIPPSQLLRILNASVVGVVLLEDAEKDSSAEQEDKLCVLLIEGDESRTMFHRLQCKTLGLVQSIDALSRRVELVLPFALPARTRLRLILGSADIYPSSAFLSRRNNDITNNEAANAITSDTVTQKSAASSLPYLAMSSQLQHEAFSSIMTTRPSLQRKKYRKS